MITEIPRNSNHRRRMPSRTAPQPSLMENAERLAKVAAKCAADGRPFDIDRYTHGNNLLRAAALPLIRKAVAEVEAPEIDIERPNHDLTDALKCAAAHRRERRYEDLGMGTVMVDVPLTTEGQDAYITLVLRESNSRGADGCPF